MRSRSRVLWLALVGVVVSLAVAPAALAAPPTNDNFASATALSGALPITFTGSNVEATGEVGEPNHGFYSLRSDCYNATTTSNQTTDFGCEPSVWWTWTAPSNGGYVINLCASDFTTTLGVYTGDAVDQLTKVASSFDDLYHAPCDWPSKTWAIFTASAGTIYRIGISGQYATTGNISGVLRSCSDPQSGCGPPTAQANGAVAAGTTQATLQGYVDPRGQDTTYQFDYGTTDSYGSSIPAPAAYVGNDTASHSVSQAISGLTSGQLYHYRIRATNGSGTTSTPDQTFSTQGPPGVITSAIDGGSTSADLRAKVDPDRLNTTYHFEWGATTSYGHSTAPGTLSPGDQFADVDAMVNGLTPGATYHFRVSATNEAGTRSGADKSFTTVLPPVASTSRPSNVGLYTSSTFGATLNGLVNPGGGETTYFFEWGPSTSYGNTTDPSVAGSGVKKVAVGKAVNGLSQGVVYHYRITATNVGGTVSGTDQTVSYCGDCSDFNKDTRSDIAWFNKRTGRVSQWLMNGSAVSTMRAVDKVSGNLAFAPVDTTDFNRDGNADILWFDPSTRALSIWYLDGAHYLGSKRVDRIAAAGWRPVAVGGVAGPGNTSILWRNSSTGYVSLWEVDNAHVRSLYALSPQPVDLYGSSWAPVTMHDYDGNGWAEVVARDVITGELARWDVRGSVFQGAAVPGFSGKSSAANEWKLISTGDFDADHDFGPYGSDNDGSADLLWRNARTGQVSVWIMSYDSYVAAATVTGDSGQPSNPSSDWRPI